MQEKLARASVRFDFVYDEPGLMEGAQQDEEEARRQELSRLQMQAEVEAEMEAELDEEEDAEEERDGGDGEDETDHGA